MWGRDNHDRKPENNLAKCGWENKFFCKLSIIFKL